MKMESVLLESNERKHIFSRLYDCLHEEQQDISHETFNTNYTDTLHKSLITMRVNHPELCDVRIKTGGSEIVAHSIILATFSKYFKTLFTTKLKYSHSSNEGFFIVDLSQFSQLSVEFFIQLVYNNYWKRSEKQFEEIDIGEFMMLLDFTALDLIQDILINSVSSLVTTATWCKWYLFADISWL